MDDSNDQGSDGKLKLSASESEWFGPVLLYFEVNRTSFFANLLN